MLSSSDTIRCLQTRKGEAGEEERREVETDEDQYLHDGITQFLGLLKYA